MAEIPIESILPDIENLIEMRQSGSLKNIIIDLHPADIESILNRLKKEDRQYLFSLMSVELASEVLAELDQPVVEQLIEETSDNRLTKIIDHMDSDDAADIVAELPEEVASRVLDKLQLESSEDLKELLTYEEDTAGGIMAREFIALSQDAKVNEAIDEIRERREEFDAIYNIWVVDENKQLVGSVSLTDLVLAHGNTQLKSIMDVELRPIEVNTDQEEVAIFFKKYELVSAPVVNELGQMVGRITVDDIVDVLEEEGSEDIARISGAPEEELQEESTFVLSRARVPWLLVAFVGEIIAALVLNSYSATIDQMIATALFIPIIMAMGGSSGQQATVIVIRGLAIGDIDLRDTWRRLFKELKISLLNSLFFSVILFTLVYFWHGLLFASILSGSMFIVINNAAVVGALIPFMFKRFNIDPALAATPFVATFNDVFGLLIYLSITTFAISYAA